jgi:Zn-dependent M32 family carboxypeptidase
MSIAPPLSNTVAIYNAIKAQLAEEFDLENDDAALLGTLDGETNLHEILSDMAREVERYEGFAEALKRIIEQNKERKDRFERKADKLRQSIGWAMQEAGLKKVESADVTLSLRNNPPSLVTTIEPEDAPEQFRTVKTTYAFDKKAIKEALLEGDSLSFAHLNNQPPSLQIRTR